MVIRRNSKRDSNPRWSSKSGQQHGNVASCFSKFGRSSTVARGGRHVPVPSPAPSSGEVVDGFELVGAAK